MRIALGGIVHETNTYCSAPTPLEDFYRYRGAEILAEAEGGHSSINGILDAASEIGAEVVPTFYSIAQPSGTIERAAYTDMLDELLTSIEAALPLDAVALDLHGAGVAEGEDDIERDIAARVRALVGDAPIVGPLDLHGNLTQAFADVMDVPLGFRTYPHVDGYDRGFKATMLIPRIIAGEVRPVTHVEFIPMLMAPATTNPGHPGGAMKAFAEELDARDGIIDCHVFHGFALADTPLVGVHAVAIADGDADLAASTARELASWIWDHRADFRPDSLSPAEAIDRARAIDGRPVVINDTADNCGGGAPGDATHVLRAMLGAGLDSACLSFIYDPETASQAHVAGVGASIDVRLGGKTDGRHGAPIEASARVDALSDGVFRLNSMGRTKQNYGPMARLRIEGIDVLVGSRRSQTFDPEVFSLHGIDVREYDIVVVKSSNHFRDGFEPIAAAIVTADSPGLTTLRIETFERGRTRRPIWPLDDDARYP